MNEYTELKRAAEAAPSGPWVAENDSLYFKDDGYTRHLMDADAGHDVEDDAYYAALNFIAAANPAAVLALIAENERLQSAARTLERLRYTDNGGELWKPPIGKKPDFDLIDQLRAELAGLRTGFDAQNEVIAGLRMDRTDWQAECLKRGFEYVRESDDHYVLADVPEMADLLGAMLGVEVRSKENDAYEEANSQLNEQIEGLISTIHAQESMRKDAERWKFVRNPIGRSSFAIWSEGTRLFLGKFADEAIDAAMAAGSETRVQQPTTLE